MMLAKIPFWASLLGLLFIPAIPSYAQTDRAQANAVEAWKKAIVIQLASKKVFPPAATGQSGTAKIKFVIDRQGKLLSKVLVESSGSESLDAAALSMVERAGPFPEPPADLRDDTFTFVAPVQFAGRKLLPWAGGQWPAGWVEDQRKVDAKIHGVCRGC